VFATAAAERDRFAWISIAASAAMLVALISFGWLGSFTRLVNDDFDSASYPPVAAFTRLVYDYFNYFGRYAEILTKDLLLPLGTPIVRVLPATVLALWLLGLLWLFRELLAREPGGELSQDGAGTPSVWRNALLVSSVVLWATIEGAMSPGQSLYWASGMLAYVAPMVLQTYLVAAILRRDRRATRARAETHFAGTTQVSWWPLASIGLAAFVTAGFSETNMALQAAMVGIAIFATRTASPVLRHALWTAGLATAVGCAIQVLAPGIVVRQAGLAVTCGPASVLTRAALVGPASAIRLLFCKPASVAALLAAGVLARRQQPLGNPGAREVRNQLLLILSSTWAMTLAAALPASYTMCLPPNSRSHVVVHFCTVLAVLGCGYVLGGLSGLEPRLIQRQLFVPAVCVLLIGAPLWSVFDVVGQSRDAARYAAAWDARDRKLRAAARAFVEDVTVEPLPEGMNLVLGMNVPGRDPMAEWNLIVAQYYGLRTFRVTEDTPGSATLEPWTKEWCAHLYHRLRESGVVSGIVGLPGRELHKEPLLAPK
jgi:hypothetical protein